MNEPIVYKWSRDTLVLPDDLDEISEIYGAARDYRPINPKRTVNPGDYTPIIRLETRGGQGSLFEGHGRTISPARWGLVPNEFSSHREADKYGLHCVRGERARHQRAVAGVFSKTRCIVPVRGAVLEGIEPLAGRGEVIGLAGIWTRFERPRMRLESAAILTRLDRRDGSRSLVTLHESEVEAWLDLSTPIARLETIIDPIRVYGGVRAKQQVAMSA